MTKTIEQLRVAWDAAMDAAIATWDVAMVARVAALAAQDAYKAALKETQND